MRAAVLHGYGEPPVVEEFREPEGEAVVAVSAAGLNPIDLRLASGTLARRPPLPSVVGGEGVGMLDGRRVYFDMCVPPFGALAERVPVDPSSTVEVPEGIEDAHAVCYGIAGLAAWLALERRGGLQSGETVIVLGASGVVGLIAVQAARLLGAARVVAVARSAEGLERAVARGADAAVRLTGQEVATLAGELRDACGGGADLVLDPLWGEPATAALMALNFRGRLVQLGQSAGATAALPSVDVRFKELSVLGHTNFAAPPDVRHAALRRMWGHAAAGELVADHETVPLAEAADAWRRQASSPNTKLVVVP